MKTIISILLFSSYLFAQETGMTSQYLRGDRTWQTVSATVDTTAGHIATQIMLATKQAAGTYLVPSDSTLLHNEITGKQASGTYLVPSDSTLLHNEIIGRQIAGTYTVPSDTTLLHNEIIAKVNKADSATYPGYATLTNLATKSPLAGSSSLTTFSGGTFGSMAKVDSTNYLVKDTAAFTTTATRLAIYEKGVVTTSVIVYSTRALASATFAPLAADLCSVACKTDSVILTRSSGGTSGLKVGIFGKK